MGRTKANVFPVPVCAFAITSFPSSTDGIVRSWMEVGSTIPNDFNVWLISFRIPSCKKSSKANHVSFRILMPVCLFKGLFTIAYWLVFTE